MHSDNASINLFATLSFIIKIELAVEKICYNNNTSHYYYNHYNNIYCYIYFTFL